MKIILMDHLNRFLLRRLENSSKGTLTTFPFNTSSNLEGEFFILSKSIFLNANLFIFKFLNFSILQITMNMFIASDSNINKHFS